MEPHDAVADRADQPSPKRVFIKSYGCQMNVYDSERMADLLAPHGYGLAEAAEDADLIILNTCHIRAKATDKVYSELGQLKLLKQERADGRDPLMIAVAGCVAQAEGEELKRRQPAIDLVVGPQAYHKLPELIARVHRQRGETLATEFEPQAKFDALSEVRQSRGYTAFLTVQEGCDKFCTFCVVPYTRGPEWSRPAGDIVREALRLVDQGIREITLLGQNVNAYHHDGVSLAGLIAKLAGIDGLERIRFTTSHPRDMGDDLIEAHATIDKLMPYLHLPVQSGSDRILRAMNRDHKAADYLKLVERVRTARPDLALSGDFIVGFPGESEADFQQTLDLVEATSYASAYSFKYSRRPGTPAAALPGQVSDEVSSERLARLQALLLKQQQAFRVQQVGRILPVLFERAGRYPGQGIGRSPYLQSVHCEQAGGLLGTIRPVRIVSNGPNSLAGELLQTAEAL